MRWTILASALLHITVLVVAAVFLRPSPRTGGNSNGVRPAAQQNSAVNSLSETLTESIEFDLVETPAISRPAEPQTRKAKVSPSQGTRAKTPPTKPSFNVQRIEGNYQISISPSFTGSNRVKEPASAPSGDTENLGE